LSPA